MTPLLDDSIAHNSVAGLDFQIVKGGIRMQYECKQCGTEFTKAWGSAKCPKCKSKDLWITGGETTTILLSLAIAITFLAVLYLVSYVAFFGGIIGVVVAFPFAVWFILRRRKNHT